MHRGAPPSRSRFRSPACNRDGCTGCVGPEPSGAKGIDPSSRPLLLADAFATGDVYGYFCNQQARRKQKPMSEDPEFELTEFTPYLLNAAAEAQSLRFSRVYKDRYGMLRTEWRVLFHLGRHGAMSAREISQRASTHKPKVSRMLALGEISRADIAPWRPRWNSTRHSDRSMPYRSL